MKLSNGAYGVHPFGKENTNYITVKDMDSIIDEVVSYDDACSTPSKLIKLIHFNPEHPENHNMKIKDNEVFIYNGSGWLSEDKALTINKLVQKSYNMIGNYYNRRKILFLKRNIILREKQKLIEKFPSLESNITNLLKDITSVQLDIKPLLQNGDFETIRYKKTLIDVYTSEFLNNYFKIKYDLHNVVNLDEKEKDFLLKQEEELEKQITPYQPEIVKV